MRGDRSAPRISYLRGELELMTPSRYHENDKTRFARVLEAWAEETGTELEGGACATQPSQVPASAASGSTRSSSEQPMKLRNDPTTWEHVPFESTAWIPSPEANVTLDLDGSERGAELFTGQQPVEPTGNQPARASRNARGSLPAALGDARPSAYTGNGSHSRPYHRRGGHC